MMSKFSTNDEIIDDYHCGLHYHHDHDHSQCSSPSSSEEHPNERTLSPPPRKKSLSPPQALSKSISSKSTHYTSSSSPNESPTTNHVAPPPKLRFVIPIKQEPQELTPLQMSPNNPYAQTMDNWLPGPSNPSPPPRVSRPPLGFPNPPPGKFKNHDLNVDFPPFAIYSGLCSLNHDSFKTHVTLDEVKNAVWDCGSSKAPGPDGFSFAFVKKYWDDIKVDILEYVNIFLDTGLFPHGSNSSFFTLILKLINPIFIKDFRPISLIGVHYKIIAKILANSLAKVIDKI
nr:transposon TX1 uncharacterized [Tanacetum cinerariifolium]